MQGAAQISSKSSNDAFLFLLLCSFTTTSFSSFASLTTVDPTFILSIANFVTASVSPAKTASMDLWRHKTCSVVATSVIHTSLHPSGRPHDFGLMMPVCGIPLKLMVTISDFFASRPTSSLNALGGQSTPMHPRTSKPRDILFKSSCIGVSSSSASTSCLPTFLFCAGGFLSGLLCLANLSSAAMTDKVCSSYLSSSVASCSLYFCFAGPVALWGTCLRTW